MSEKTKIAWCDSTVNFWEGCTKVSAGCANCYAEARDKRFTGGKLWGKGSPRRKSKSAVRDALRYNKLRWICDCGITRGNAVEAEDVECKNCGGNSHHRRRIFSLSLGDWLDDEVPIDWLAEMLDTIRRCDQVTWILCTKRPENFMDRMYSAAFDAYRKNDKNPLVFWIEKWARDKQSPANIILLTSVENQPQADKRIPELLKIPAACHGLSMEPLLGPVTLPETPMEYGLDRMWPKKQRIKWIIIGGESGANARPCNVDWIRKLVQQGKDAGVATFVKQLGANSAFLNTTTHLTSLNLADKKGGDPAEWPADLRVQEFPRL